MAEKQLRESEDAVLDDIVATPYKYGFTTDIETEEFEKGLDIEVVRKISRIKPTFNWKESNWCDY